MSLADRVVWRKGVAHLKRRDPVLGRLIRAVGPIDFKVEDGHYESLVGAIVFQQLAGAAAQAILNRFMKLYDGKVPKPEAYLATDESKLRGAGLSPQKISYIRDLCQRLVDGSLNLRGLADKPDNQVVEQLDAVKGIGRWTAEMFLLFVLGRTDVLPVDDLGLQKAAKRIYRLRALPSKQRFEKLAKNWHPYSSVATMYLWRSGEKPGDAVKW
ncbi:DNA-3-methyladenine glycosylase 2 family protein [Candidatus Bathyarchaeota archaeon]|nr:MAG: DNA-3-methyladenine glycosylase 2 family protein [Candidatus Bathyarchaeota archaeon]